MKKEMKKFMILGLIAALSIVVPVMASDLPIVDCPTALNSCTANDISTTVKNVEILENRCGTDGTIDLRITADYSTAGGDSRYDLGVFVAEDGGSLDGKDPSALVCSGAYGPIPPFIDLDASTPGDTCGDISDETITWTFDVTADCSNIVDGVLEVPSCRFWNIAGHNDFCSGSPGENAGTGAKCDCTPFEVEVPPPDLCNGVSCDDDNPCTTDSCIVGSGLCEHINNSNACDDGNACTEGDACSGGSCAAGSDLTCDDQNSCTNDSCNTETGCVFTPNDSCETPVPEFPSLALPAALIIGFLGVVLFLQGTKKQ